MTRSYSQDEAPFDSERFSTVPYILWVDTESFKSTTLTIQSSLDMCGYQRIWKFKTVERMKVFLDKSMASKYIRTKGTKFVFVSSGGLSVAKAGTAMLSCMDLLPMLGMILLVTESPQNYDFLRHWARQTESIPPHIIDRITVCNSWVAAVSTLITWRYTSSEPISGLLQN